MWDLLLLGIVPGTDIQINFSNWLMASSALAAGLMLALMIKRRRQIVLLCIPAYRYLSAKFWLLMLRFQLARQLRRSATLW
jgi:hypothetical protein